MITAVSDAVPLPLLEGLAPEEALRFTELFDRRTYPAGTEIVRQGERGDSFFVVERGSLVVRSAERGHLARLGRGASIGEAGLFTGEPASATVSAVTDAVLRVAPQAALRKLAEEYPALARSFCRLLGQRLASAAHSVERNGLVLLVSLGESVGIQFALNLATSIAHHLQQEVALIDAFSAAPSGGGPDVAPTFKHPPQRLTIVRSAGLPPDQLAPLAEALARRCKFVLMWAPEEAVERLTPLAAAADRILWLAPHASGRSIEHGGNWPPGIARELVVLGAPEPRSVAAREAIENDLGLPVAALLPELPRALRQADAAPDWVLRCRDTPFAREMARLARRLCGKSVGLALGAGSGRGHAHLGVLRALEKLDIRPDFVAGTSVGACVAAYSLMGVPPHEVEFALQRLGQYIRQWTLPVYSLRAGAGLERALRSAIPDDLLVEHFDVPCGFVAADLSTGQAVILRRGTVWRCLRASASIPGIFPPLWLDGRLLVDGGVASPVPCRALQDMGADLILGVSLEVDARPPAGGETEGANGPEPRPPTWPQTLLRALDVQQQSLARQCLQDADVALRVMTPPLPLTDFRGGPELLEAGERAVASGRERLRTLLPWVT